MKFFLLFLNKKENYIKKSNKLYILIFILIIIKIKQDNFYYGSFIKYTKLC